MKKQERDGHRINKLPQSKDYNMVISFFWLNILNYLKNVHKGLVTSHTDLFELTKSSKLGIKLGSTKHVCF